MFGETERSVEGERQLTVELPLYGREGLLRACYAFTDRCFLFLREAGPSKVTVVFRKRQSPKTLDALVEEFAQRTRRPEPPCATGCRDEVRAGADCGAGLRRI